MIKEAYVSLEVAKLLKEKGFDIECKTAYYCDCLIDYTMFGFCGDEELIFAPTQQLAMAWLREVHHIAINIGWGEVFEEQYRWWSIVLNMDNGDLYDEHYNATYEESVETTLKYVLENLI